MRQVFSSQRLENVEAVAQMLRDADIEVRITHDRSYKGNRRGTFSYSDHSTPKPAVWVVKSNDQVRARAMLREAGLIDSTRDTDSFVASSFRFDPQSQARTPASKRAFRIKLVLIAGIAVVGTLALVQALNKDPATEALKTHPLDGSPAAVPQPLAAAVMTRELAKARFDVLCLAVDGKDAPPGLVKTMQRPKTRVVPASQCVRISDEEQGSVHRASGRPALLVDVHAFRPQTRESGQVEYTAYHHRMSATYKILEVKRVDGTWQVVRTIKHVAS
ncbi:hypothetical protein ACFOLC_08990 [Lysobacter cavernae]|uniref:DUF2007 domain-containing protein n=1 Tax=Lysobacter cavernae TaxID=1685901 RepID=A0ABV7RQP4_9GAMM